MQNLLAQIPVDISGNKEFHGIGPLGLEGKTGIDAPGIFTNFISGVVGILTIVAIIWFVFTFITGAIGYITAGSNKESIESAKKRIVNGLIGLVAVIISIFIIKLVGTLIGIPNILDIEALIALIKF